MSDYPQQPYGGYGNQDPNNPPFHQPYPNPYYHPEIGRAAHGQMASHYNNSMPYAYNQVISPYNPAGVIPAPLPSFPTWNQETIPVPSYATPNNGAQYPAYSNPYVPFEQQGFHSFAQPTRRADEGELSEGEFDDASALKKASTEFGATQYGMNNGTGYVDTAHRAISQNNNYSPLQSYPAGATHNYDYGRDSQQGRQHGSGSYSPYASPINAASTEQSKVDVNYPVPSQQRYVKPNVTKPDFQNSLLKTGRPDSPKSGTQVNGNHLTQGVENTHPGVASGQSLPATIDSSKHNPVLEARKKAQSAILDLLPYKVGYKNYIDEGIDESVIGSLFDELQLSRASETAHGVSPQSNSDGQSVSKSQPTNLQDIPAKSNLVLSKADEMANNHKRLAPISTKNGGSGQPSNSPAGSSPTAVKSAAATEKERTLQMKMEALRKSREERAQKAAAKNNIKPTPVAAFVVDSETPKSTTVVSVPAPTPDLPAIQLQQPISPIPEPRAEPTSKTQPILVIPGLFLGSNTLTPPSATTPSTAISGPIQTSQRKRPVAADFDGPPNSATAFKRPFGQNRNDKPFVIDVSDEDSEDDDVAMELESQADQSSPAQSTRKLSEHRAAAIENLPPLTEFPVRKPFTPPPASSTMNTPPITYPARPTISQPEILQRKESEIEELKRRIFEAERKRKARQSSSGAQTPRQFENGTNQEYNNVNTIASKVEASIQMQNMIEIAEEKVTSEQNRLAEAQAAELQKTKEIENDEAEIKRLRRTKIASDLPLVDSDLQRKKTKLEEMRAEMARIEAEVQNDLEQKKKLEEEMTRLGEEAEEQLQAEKDKLNDLTNEAANASSSPSMADVDQADPAPTPVNIQSSLSFIEDPNPTNETSQVDTEQPVDVPGASEVAFETQTNNSFQAGAPSETTPAMETTSDEQKGIAADQVLEAALQEAMRAEADSDARTDNDVDMEDSFAPEPSQLILDLTSNPSDEDNHSPIYSPTLSQRQPDIPENESDTYEPPDATPSVEMPLAVDSPPFSPAPPDSDMEFTADFNPEDQSVLVLGEKGDQIGSEDSPPFQSSGIPQPAETGIRENSIDNQFFTPYESPLAHFRAYRFHPEFNQKVNGGQKSLTYSHKIDPNKELCRFELAGGICNDSSCELQHFRNMGIPDDVVLTALGSPDEFSGEQKERFVEGLREVLTNLRRRKVKDFDAIAAEIVAHRSKFLGDKSKILVLEGTTI
ncbi:hypothetical protein B7494_g2480 [Chlorociboria aeruginascens]|nr:hypothetical protein B7494_g2480 [Chlorociboria aeruginascens]